MHATVTELLRAGLAALERHNEDEARARFVEARETERRAAGGRSAGGILAGGTLPGTDLSDSALPGSSTPELFAQVSDPDALYFAALATGQLGENPLGLARRAVEAYRVAPPSLRAARAWETYGYFLHDAARDAAAAQAMQEAAGVYEALVGTKPSRLMRCITPESPTRKPAISPLLSQLWKRRCYLRVRCRRWIWGGWLFGPLLPRRAWTPGSSLRPRAITGRRRWLSRRSRARNLMRLIALSGEPARCSGAGTTRPPRSISRR